MAASVKLVYRKDKMNEQGMAPVYIRLTKHRKVNYIATDIRLQPIYWDQQNARIKSSYPNSAQANNYLTGLLFKYQAEALKEQTVNGKVSARALKEKLTGATGASFFEVANSLLLKYKSAKKIGTHDKTQSIVNKIRQYVKSSNLMLQDINTQFLTRFERSLL